MTSDVNHADVAFACNSWMEFTYPEMTGTVSNPVDSDLEGRDPAAVRHPQRCGHLRRCRRQACEMTGDVRFRGVFHNRVDEPRRRLSAADAGCQPTCYGYSADVMLKSEKGWMVMGRTYPQHPLWEETNESNRTGRGQGGMDLQHRRPGPSNTAKTSSPTGKARSVRRICRMPS